MTVNALSICARACSSDSRLRLGCDHVCVPIVWPSVAISLTRLGYSAAISPSKKNVALVQCAANAARIVRENLGVGPSSNVKTTSPGARKSLSPCGLPNHGPPVVSISAVRETPRAFGEHAFSAAAPGISADKPSAAHSHVTITCMPAPRVRRQKAAESSSAATPSGKPSLVPSIHALALLAVHIRTAASAATASRPLGLAMLAMTLHRVGLGFPLRLDGLGQIVSARLRA